MLMAKRHDTDQKLRELILHVARKCEEDPKFGATKLNKILFFADFWRYAETGKPITGQAYFRLDKGPAPRRLVPVRKDMERRGELATQTRRYFGHVQHRPVALRDPDLGCFSGAEIALVDEVIRRLWNLTAAEVSDLSHQFVGWEAFGDREDIPYETVFVSGRRLTRKELDYGRSLEASLGS